jgi:two-component system CheB/CheR fusion protein
MPSRDDSSFADRLQDMAMGQVETHALVLMDRSGTIVGWRGGSERLFGYTADEVIGQNASILFVPEDLEKGLSHWEQMTADVAAESEDDRWQLRKDGVRIWVSGTLTALRDERGELVGFAKIMRNRSDQKFQVEALERRLVACEQGQQRKNAFVATLAHELRSPLSALSNASVLLQGWESADGDLALMVGLVRRQVEFMSRLADDLLEVARAASGRVELQTSPLVLQEVVDLAIETSRAAVDEQGLSLVRLYPQPPIHLEGDRIRLGQVFINLIQNATKFTERGGTIWVKVTIEGEEAVVRVKDSGIGIEPDVMPYIFDLFTQAEPANPSRGGLGIGLSIVKNNVAMHGGTVQVTSDGRGRGSEFAVRLPLTRTSATMPQDT